MVKIVEPSFTLMTEISQNDLMIMLEAAGRTCYKSEEKITSTSAALFIQNIAKNGHHSVLEHGSLTVRIVCDRGVSHELVRHRIASYSQESTRYVNYKEGLTLIKPCMFEQDTPLYDTWLNAMIMSEKYYQALIASGATAQEARSVLPNSLKTEVVITANIREWAHIIKLRTSKAAHPQMREIMLMIQKHFVKQYPAIFLPLLIPSV